MKAYNINLASRQSFDPEGSKGFVAALRRGTLRAFRKHFAAEDPYCLRRRLLRTVLKRIAALAILALPLSGITRSAECHRQSTPLQTYLFQDEGYGAVLPNNPALNRGIESYQA